MTLRRAAWWLFRAAWILLVAALIVLFDVSATDPASMILFALALLALAAAIVCARRAIEALGAGAKLVWTGRALGLLGAALMVSVPANLYQEIRWMIARGQSPSTWHEEAIWVAFAVMPLVVLPAVLSLRSARVGGILFLLDLVYVAVDTAFHPFGVAFPDATGGFVEIAVLIFLPPLLTSLLLLVGSTDETRASAPSALRLSAD